VTLFYNSRALATFPLDNDPTEFLQGQKSDCRDLAHLSTFLLTKQSEHVILARGGTMPDQAVMPSGYLISIEVVRQSTVSFMDFLDACMISTDLEILAQHRFLDVSENRLDQIVEPAVLKTYRPCRVHQLHADRR
jgi:hypothetical protein